jgi:hypothetical protein
MNILSQLEEHAKDYDLQAMDTLVESLSPVELEENKQEIIKTYDMVYRSGMYDLDGDTINDREEFISFLLRIIGSIQRFFPDRMYYQERGRCYEHLVTKTNNVTYNRPSTCTTPPRKLPVCNFRW